MVAVALLCSKTMSQSNAFDPSGNKWMDPNAPVAQRVEALLSQMTMSDKIWQLRRPDWNPSLPLNGTGVLEYAAVVQGAANATEVVQNRNAIQRAFLSQGPGARLGIPVSFRLLSIHGAEAFGTTFPEGPGLGATWDTDLITQVAAAIATEGRALGADMFLPVINLWADARFGRQEEGFSEEPTLTSALASALVLGAQGSLGLPIDAYLDNATQMATVFKHVGGYGAAAGGMNGARADVPEHSVREVYLKPWRRAAAAGGRGVMPAHSTLLGVPSHASTWLLRDRLRGDFNMSKGIFISDTGDVAALAAFRLCSDDASCAALAINAGVDIEQVGGQTYLSLPEAIQRGLTTQELVDDAVRHVLTHKFATRLFDSPYTDETLAASVVNSAHHRDLALIAAVEGTVLLQNKGTLPLKKDGSLRIAVVGPNAGCGTSGSGNGTLPLCDAQGAYLGNYAEGMDPLTGVQTVAQAVAGTGYAGAVTFDRGCNIDDADASLVPAAIASSMAADVTVAVLGDSLGSCGEGHDRDDLDLPGGQMQLLTALAGLGKPLVVVIIHCRAATFGAADGNALLGNISALMAAWRPGQMGGQAIASLLFGDANPSGHLPMNWVRSVGQSNGPASPWLQERASLFDGPAYGSEGRRYGGYVQAANPTTPLFPFGFGLSYTTFQLSGFTVTVQAGNQSYPVVASVTVSNSGGVPGATVVQVYVQDPTGTGLIVRPWKRLAAFARTPVLAAGASVPLTLPIRADDLAYYGDDMVLRVYPGVYTGSVGLDSVDDTGPGHVQSFEIAAGQGFVPALLP